MRFRNVSSESVVMRAQRHILLLIHSMAGGGAERVTTRLASEWIKSGHAVTILTVAGKDLDCYPIPNGVVRHALDIARDSKGMFDAIKLNIQRLVAVRRYIRKTRPDIVIGMMATAGIVAGLATFGLPCRTISAERAYPAMLPLGRLWARLRRLVYPRLSSVVVQTSAAASWMHTHVPKAAVHVIPNPIVWPLERLSPHIDPQEFVTSNVRTVLAVGRLSPEKQFSILIHAFAEAAAGLQDWQLVILGAGPERAALQALAAKLAIPDRVLFPGRAGNVADWYKRADIFVLSSLYEGFPNALVEAMASGCAVVSFDCLAGPADLVTHNHDGVLVPPDSAQEGLAAAIRALILDEGRRSALSAAALAVRERLAIAVIAAKWESIFDQA
ncbi:glycosyltransferase family 4 protein [Chitiniphilus purpureus]|uniref:Glycosyltransferase family 4 protein n=1 Tax=Chitiniphilus purpureus TaxID=2981137 RepID=A0ABY6DKB2_9NEIS|nr:glycosyltransferase family 4 protein [Chitiniphilus sp. CD1]UXY14477.1 glycosyltransferase family 4 protein [Chitiniphilus sp. CD1]